MLIQSSSDSDVVETITYYKDNDDSDDDDDDDDDFFAFCRVTLVERGSPHSLCLLESGKVGIFWIIL